MHARPNIFITGLGAISSVGRDVDALWQAIARGRTGIAPITRFPTTSYAVGLAAEIPGVTGDDGTDEFYLELAHVFALTAAREAWLDARLDTLAADTRVAIVFGTSTLHRRSSLGGPALHQSTEALAAALGIEGQRITVSTACVSSTLALGLGCDLLRTDDADLVLVGGVCILSEPNFAGFHALGVLSAEPCAPFAEPPGTTLGEGAGFVVLERLEHATRRGVTLRARLEGYGTSADGYHATAPDPRGGGVARALSSALKDAGHSPDAIDYVKMHGTGTTTNDPAEWRAIQQVFGARAATLPISGLKGMLGHTQDACGVLELQVTLLALEHGVLPPTLHCVRQRRHGPSDPVPGPLPRPSGAQRVLCTNSAFGGANAAVVMALPGTPPARVQPASSPLREVLLVGAGAAGLHKGALGDILPEWRDGLKDPKADPSSALAELLASEDTRGLDPSCLWLSAAATMALRDAGVRLTGALKEQAGLMLGVARESRGSAREFWKSLEQRGAEGTSARAFAHIVLNAPAGVCARLLGLRGPHGAISTGSGSGLMAVLTAAQMLQSRSDARLMVAGGVDESLCEARSMPTSPTQPTLAGSSYAVHPPESSAVLPSSPSTSTEKELALEGAACVVLATRDVVPDRAAIRLAGWAIAGPGRLPDAIRSALERAGQPRDAVEALFGIGLLTLPGLEDAVPTELRRIDPGTALGPTEASGSVVALAAALGSMRRGLCRVALVVEGSGHSVSLALVLTSGG